MGRKVNVIGVGMVPFAKPGQSEDYNVMAAKAIKTALADGGVEYAEVEQAVAGYVFGDSTCGQRAVYDVGLTGIPVYNVNNNCSTGSSALMLAKQMVEGGIEEQTERVLRNLASVLESGGGSLRSVVKTTVYLVDLSDFLAMNGVYGRFFTENPPARATVQVSKLPAGALVEIDAVASVE